MTKGLLASEQKNFSGRMDAFNEYSNFMSGSLDKNNKKEFAAFKAFAIVQATISTYRAAIAAYSAMAGIPFVGPALGSVAAAAAVALGTRNITKIASQQPPAAFEGAMIKGSSAGSIIRAGERNKTEAIIPLQNEEAMSKLQGSLGGGGNLTVHVENLYGSEDLPRRLIEKIDQGLYNLRRNNASASFAGV